jgi:hypothetical protein
VLTLKIEKLSRSIGSDSYLADLTKSKALAKVAKSRSNTSVVEPILSKTKYWSIFYRRKRNQCRGHDKGMTTGEQQLVITEMQVNDIKADKAVAGDVCTFHYRLEFAVR